ncbi:hypothetical protein FGG08_001149 [Glutinoglossum americanum]|uniref:Uncharacterized protein n=1 Tax=Glutinoglossum americanum TaxID=1670608 RepID=A0A9P8L6F8_9PEZI|nr:hypothetical protein FGG08_001149 [Glutinoglossum americanum]
MLSGQRKSLLLPLLSFLTFQFPHLAAAQTCTLTVPTDPLSSKGLSSPYRVAGCDQRQFADQGTFVEAAIFDPSTNKISIYNPLVVNDGDKAGKDFLAPDPVTVPYGAAVGIWFGSNAGAVLLKGDIKACVNGLGDSLFGQATKAAFSAGKLKIASPGTGVGSQPCPVVRDFRVVDQDQSDNVDTTYLLINKTILAQNTPAKAKANPDAEVLSNGSDNALLNKHLSPALDCAVLESSSLTSPTGKTASLATNELQANFFPPSSGPALVPLNGAFSTINTNGTITQSLEKTNLYRLGVGQPPGSAANASGTTYCRSFAAGGLFIAQNTKLFAKRPSPNPAAANNLFTFLANRFGESFGPVPFLGCEAIFGVGPPVSVAADGGGVVTAASINTKVLQSILDGKIKPAAATVAATTTAVATTAKAAVTSSVGDGYYYEWRA